MKNFTLCFWEAADDFTFEKVIVTTTSTIECQINIWYINFLDTWITTDSDGVFYFWDLLHHKVTVCHHITGEPLKDVMPDKFPEEKKEGTDLKEYKFVESKINEDPKDLNSLINRKDPKAPIDILGPHDSKSSKTSQLIKISDQKDKGLGTKRNFNDLNFSKDGNSQGQGKISPTKTDRDMIVSNLHNPKTLQQVKDPGKGISFLEKTDVSAVSKSNRTTELQRKSEVSKVDRFKSKLGIVHYLLEITEITYIKLVALASTDKHIRIWDVSDIFKPKIIFCLNLIKGGVHQMKFLGSFQVMVVAGYENSIPVFNITPRYYDVNVVGRLVGHVSIVTALEVLEGSAMVISADDTGCIKTWDIRSFQCYQTIEMSHKTIIGQLLNMDNINKVAFIGCRVNFIEFDRSDKFAQKIDLKQQVPLKADINLTTEELIICTNSDIKFLDLNTGRLKKIYAHMISQDGPDEISVFRMIQKNHRFVLGDPKGDIMIFAVTNAEKLLKLESHGLQVVDVKVDTYNKLLVSAGGDSRIIIQRERLDDPKKQNLRTMYDDEEDINDINLLGPDEIIKKINKEDRITKKSQFQSRIGSLAKTTSKDPNSGQLDAPAQYEVLRTITHTHKDAGITCIALSVYHNLIASASHDNIVFIYDYEYGKFLTGVELEVGNTVTALEFINGLGVLLICSNNGYCYFLSVINQQGKQDFSVLGKMKMKVSNEITITKNDTKIAPKNSSPSQSLKELPKPKTIEVRSGPSSIGEIDSKPILYAEKIYVALSLKGEHKDLEDFKKVQVSEPENLLLNNCEVYFGLQNGFVAIYQFTSYFQNFKIVKHSNTKLNYNPFRTNLEDCSALVLNQKTLISLKEEHTKGAKSLDSFMIRSFFGHKGGFTSIGLIKVPEEHLITTGNDKYIKVISKTGECLAAWNVNHPLPLKWTLRVDSNQDMKNRVLFALKVIQAIFKRYYNLLYAEGKVFDLKGFLQEYQNIESLEGEQKDQSNPQQSNIFQLTSVPAVENGPKVRVMSDDYLAKDFASGKLQELYFQELLGPSLKLLDTKRRLLLVQEEWIKDEKRSDELQQTLKKKEEGKKVRRYSEDGMEQENFGAYIEKAKNLANNNSEKIMKLNNEFRKIENSKFKDLSRKDSKNSKVQGTIVLDSVIVPSRPTAKGTLVAISRQNTTFQGSSIEKHSHSRSKVDFYQFAEKKKLLNTLTPGGTTDKKERSIDSTEARLQKKLDDCIDFTEDGRIKRIQKATRELIKEKSDFSQIMHNINDRLKRSQVKNLNSRKASLPVMKPALNQQAYNPFQSVLPPVGKKSGSIKGSKYSLLK